MDTIPIYINGEWRYPTGKKFDDVNPAVPHEIVAQFHWATERDVDEAVSCAVNAQVRWAARPQQERSQILVRAAELVEATAPEWGRELTREQGKTLAEGIGEVMRAAAVLPYAAGESERDAGEIFASPRRGERILVSRHPVGVIGCITPWNFPIAIPAWKIAPALVHGNSVVWKPSEVTPLLAHRLASALHEAGLPPGVLNLLNGGAEVGTRIVSHPAVTAVTFTGSTPIGREILATCGQLGKAAQAEMGGKNAAVVLHDADLELASSAILRGAMGSAGQRCTATSRVIADTAIAQDLLAALSAGIEKMVVGDPLDDATEVGPVISAASRDRVWQAIETARTQGADVVCGGKPYEDSFRAQGYFVPPTILAPLDQSTDFWTTEVFGPVLGFVQANNADEAFKLANLSDFGLSAAIFTSDLGRALAAIDTLDVGVLHINSESTGADTHVPFGGTKASGAGPMEQGRAAREFFTRSRTVYLAE